MVYNPDSRKSFIVFKGVRWGVLVATNLLKVLSLTSKAGTMESPTVNLTLLICSALDPELELLISPPMLLSKGLLVVSLKLQLGWLIISSGLLLGWLMVSFKLLSVVLLLGVDVSSWLLLILLLLLSEDLKLPDQIPHCLDEDPLNLPETGCHGAGFVCGVV